MSKKLFNLFVTLAATCGFAAASQAFDESRPRVLSPEGGSGVAVTHGDGWICQINQGGRAWMVCTNQQYPEEWLVIWEDGTVINLVDTGGLEVAPIN